jgi:hypothetical protein
LPAPAGVKGGAGENEQNSGYSVGGSFVDASAVNSTTAATHSGDGLIEITYDARCFCAGTLILPDKRKSKWRR